MNFLHAINLNNAFLLPLQKDLRHLVLSFSHLVDLILLFHYFEVVLYDFLLLCRELLVVRILVLGQSLFHLLKSRSFLLSFQLSERLRF